MPPKKAPRASFWTRAAYRASKDDATVAIYRVVTSAMGVILLGLLGYFGNRMVAADDDLRGRLFMVEGKVENANNDISGLRPELGMMDARELRIIDRLNAIETRATKLEDRMDFVLMSHR